MSASLTMFEKEHEGRIKYSYFICSISSALVAYIGKDYFPESPIDLHDKLTLWALASLTLCFGFALLQLYFFGKGTSLNKDVLIAGEEIAKMYNSVMLRETTPPPNTPNTRNISYTINLKTGYLYKSTDELKNLAWKKRIKNAITFRKMRKWFWWSEFWFVVYHVFLIIGFTLLMVAKLIG